MSAPNEKTLRSYLVGGDRRSIAQSNRALTLLRTRPGLVGALAELVRDEDWLVSQRALDLLEKLAREHPDWVQPHKKAFTGAIADSDKWEIRLQVVRALPLLQWTRREMARVIEILRRDVAFPQTFVRAWALDSLATFAQADASLMPEVLKGLKEFEKSGSKALGARARKIRERLGAA